MTHLAWLLPTLPVLAAVLGLLGMRIVPGGPAVPAIAGSLATVVIACLVFAGQIGAPAQPHLMSTEWTPIGGFTLNVGTLVDGLAAATAVMVAVVALLVQIYSMAYMAGDTRYGTYAAEVSLFTAAMMLVVVASSLFELLVGWELMGLCSYLLIGHYHHDKVARDAAVKSFVVTRIGDVGFLFGIFVLGFGVHSFDIGHVNAVAGSTRGTPACGRCRPHDAGRRLALASVRRRRQERAVPAARLAAGRDGRPDPDQRADPRRHDGRGRHLRGGAALPGLPGRSGLADRARDHCLHHDARRRPGRARAGRPQAGAGLVDL